MGIIILIDIILHNDGISDQKDWKERVGFSVKSEGEIGWKGVHWWISKPKKIFRRFKREKEELTEKNEEYRKELEEKILKIDVLEKILKEKELIIEKQKEQIAAAELDAITHYDFIGALQELNSKVRDKLHAEIAEKSLEIDTANENLENKDEKIKEIQADWDEKVEELEKTNEEFRKLKADYKKFKNLYLKSSISSKN